MLSSFAPFFRSLTMSPAAVAIDQAHRMARRGLNAGGAAASTRRGDSTAEPAYFVLPVDIDAQAVARAVREKLRLSPPTGADALFPLQRRTDGRVVLSARWLRRIGDDEPSKGKAFVDGVIGHLRAVARTSAI